MGSINNSKHQLFNVANIVSLIGKLGAIKGPNMSKIKTEVLNMSK